MRTIIGNLVVETHTTETPDGHGLLTVAVTRLIETGEPPTRDEEVQVRGILDLVESLAARRGSCSLH